MDGTSYTILLSENMDAGQWFFDYHYNYEREIEAPSPELAVGFCYPTGAVATRATEGSWLWYIDDFPLYGAAYNRTLTGRSNTLFINEHDQRAVDGKNWTGE